MSNTNNTLTPHQQALFNAVLMDVLGLWNTEISHNQKFKDDLGFDSLDNIEFIMKLESTFDILIPNDDAEAITTVAEGHALVAQLLNTETLNPTT